MSRTYTIDEVEYPSVTTILGILDKPALVGWAANTALDYVEAAIKSGNLNVQEVLATARTEWRNVSQVACDIGHEVHELIRKYLQEGDDAVGPMRPEVENGFLAFLDWEGTNVKDWVESEKPVWNDGIGYGGTMDAVAVLNDGREVLIDFKSSKAIYDEYVMQAAAYRHAWETMRKKPLDGMGILRLDKETGKPEWKDVSDKYEQSRDAFALLVQFYYRQKNRRLKNNPFAGTVKPKEISTPKKRTPKAKKEKATV